MEGKIHAKHVDLNHLACMAVDLSAELNMLQLSCGHDSTSKDILHVAMELTCLAGELSNLNEAISSNLKQYTSAFHEDLSEIHNHLQGIFEDTSDCCKEMQKADGPGVNAIGWLHKRRYVNKLQKHLAANKTTLLVMQTVIRHGKDYGTQNSPGRLAESSPHTLKEDWAILESVFASRSAITDLQNFVNASHQHSSSSSWVATGDIPMFEPGPHGRKLSSATGVDVPAVADVLPEVGNNRQRKKGKQDLLARRFSKRGVRLAVHSSIMDLNAHDVPQSLKDKWLSQAHSGSPSIAQLSKISEVDSNSGTLVRRATTGQHAFTPPQEPSKAKKRSLTLMNTPVGKSLGKVIHRLSNVALDDYDVKEEESGPKTKWHRRLTKPFLRPELTTPDYNKDVENSALR